MPSLSDWNWYEVMLVQALLGVISNNFRMVTLRFAGDRWFVEAWLLEENQMDSASSDFADYPLIRAR